MRHGSLMIVFAGALALTGCTHPLHRSWQQEVQERLAETARSYREAVTETGPVTITRTEGLSDEHLTEQHRRDMARRLEEVDQWSSPKAMREQRKLQLGADLYGRTDADDIVMLTLQQAIQIAVQRNLTVQLARLAPAVTEAELTQSEAVFDAIFFFSADHQKLDTPRPPSASLTTFSSVRSETTTLTTGIRKVMTSGGELTVQTSMGRQDDVPSFFVNNTYYQGDISLTINQPLLRNFGADVTRAQIELSENARRRAVEDLRRTLIEVCFATEQAYWALVLSRQLVLIQSDLLERTLEDRETLGKRLVHDVLPSTYSDANARAHTQQAELIRAKQQVRVTADALKRLINSTKLPVTSETMIVPVDDPVDMPLTYDALDSITTALQRRPGVQQALLQINDATIRQRVADNARLPQLNTAATIRYAGGGNTHSGAYDAVTDGDFIEYLLTAQFEMPIGNRGPEAAYQQAILERQFAVASYQDVAQRTVLEVKDALREVMTTYELIGARRAARLAAAENVRQIQAQMDADVPLTAEFINVKLQRQESLAIAQADEMRALTDYNNAVARLYQAMGTLMERNGIEFTDMPVD